MSLPKDSSPQFKSGAQTGETVETVLSRHPFLSGFNAAHLRLLADNALSARYETGELIIQEGAPANRFYLIENGFVTLTSPDRDRQPFTLQEIGPGGVLGWSWLFPPYYWHFDARAGETTTAICFYGTRLRELCDQDHDFGYEMMKRMARVVIARLQTTRNQLIANRV